MRSVRTGLPPAGLLVLAVLAAGCAPGSVGASVPHPPAAQVAACTKLHGLLPAHVMDTGRRHTDPASPLTAAWGDPAIVLRCGVSRPAALHKRSDLSVIDGVSWFGRRQGSTAYFTTVGRAVYVEVRIPKKYRLPGQALTNLAKPIQRSIPKNPDGHI